MRGRSSLEQKKYRIVFVMLPKACLLGNNNQLQSGAAFEILLPFLGTQSVNKAIAHKHHGWGSHATKVGIAKVWVKATCFGRWSSCGDVMQ